MNGRCRTHEHIIISLLIRDVAVKIKINNRVDRVVLLQELEDLNYDKQCTITLILAKSLTFSNTGSTC